MSRSIKQAAARASRRPTQKRPDRKVAKLLVKLKFSDFRRTTAEMSGPQPELTRFYKLLDDAWGRSGEPVRLLGIGVRFAESEGGGEQLELGI